MSGIPVSQTAPPPASMTAGSGVAAAAHGLRMQSQPGHKTNPADFFELCLSLARCIDFSVANNEVPPVEDLPALLKQACQCRSDLYLQAAVMVLMISVKNACKFGWFSEKDNQELFTLANEIGAIFCSPTDVSLLSSNSHFTISTVMSRFYPLMKMGQILTAIEVKPGYGTYVNDFHISKNTTWDGQERIRLFVAEVDNIETSTCIINPQLVNFLFNGKGVERRTNLLMEPGPQVPTDVTGMLKYGMNLFQAVGQFNGHYVIAVAFMSETRLPDSSALLDYVQLNLTEPNLDSDIIEGPSRMSLNCPISYTRIKTPVKGRSCKHLQCFDFSNFVDMNSRRPSWRCPHCNQHVCYTDIRVDQNVVKVLREVGDNFTYVIMSDDGSWKAVLESDDDVDSRSKKVSNCEKDGNVGHTFTTPSTALPSVLDLTGDEDKMDAVAINDIEETNAFQAAIQAQPIASNVNMISENNLSNTNQNLPVRLDSDSWFSPSTTTVTSAALNNTPALMTSPVTSDAVSPSLSRDIGGIRNSVLNNEHGTMLQVPKHVNKTPIAIQAHPAPCQIDKTPTAIQAHPAPSQIANHQQRARPALGTAVSTVSSIAHLIPSIGTTLNAATSNMGRQLPSPSYTSLHQSWNELFVPHWLLPQQVAGRPTSGQLLGGLRAGSQNLNQQHAFHPSQIRSQSPTIWSSSPLPRTQAQEPQVGVGNAVSTPNSWNAMFLAAQQLNQIARQPLSVPVQFPTSRPHSLNANLVTTPAMEQRGNVGSQVQAVSGTGGSELTSEYSWRPTGRMRGSLSGRPVPVALRDRIIQPTRPSQQVAASGPPSNVTSQPSSGAFLPQTQNGNIN